MTREQDALHPTPLIVWRLRYGMDDPSHGGSVRAAAGPRRAGGAEYRRAVAGFVQIPDMRPIAVFLSADGTFIVLAGQIR